MTEGLRDGGIGTRQGRVGGAAVLLSAAIFLGTGACSGDAGADGAGGPVRWTVVPEPLVSVGQMEGDPRYLFDGIEGVRLLPDGGLAVADRGTASVRIYDDGGGHVTTMGGPGGGPGEFEHLRALHVLSPDTVLAYDAAAFRSTRFLTDGTLLGTWTIQTAGGWPELYVGTFSDGSAAVASLLPSPRGGTEILADRMVVARYAPEGSLVEILDTLPGIRRAGGMGAVPFTPFMHAWVMADSVYFTDGSVSTVAVLDGAGGVAREMELALPRPDLETAWQILRTELEARDQGAWLNDVGPSVEREPVPVIAQVMVDADERIWLKQYDPAVDATYLSGGTTSGGRWTVIHRDGRLLAHVDVPEGFVPMDAAARTLVGVQRDDLGVERVVTYALEG